MQKLLGIDYGDKRIGLALAELGSIAVPFKVLANNQDLLKNLQDIIQAEKINLIVVGLPRSLSGQSNDRFKITETFIKSLSINLGIPIKTVDEQYTSKLYTEQGVVKDIDKHAATAILDTYLSQNHE